MDKFLSHFLKTEPKIPILLLGGWPGNKVTLTFQSFNIETSAGCNRDYVEVHENNEEGRLLLHACGDSIPASNITAYSQLWVKFNSDAQGVAAGFTAFYSIGKFSPKILFKIRGNVFVAIFPNNL